MKQRILVRSLPSVAREIKKRLRSFKATSSTEAVAFFDLSGSTVLKLRKGHQEGVEAALRFGLAAVMAKHHVEHGRVFDPLDACRAALSVKALGPILGLTGSFGITLGRIARYAKGRKAGTSMGRP